KTILHNLSGGFRSGRVTAILGPSGSGKTTLLNLLSGYVTAGTTTGNIWVNGRPATGASMRLLAGYVNQDDVLNTKAGLKHKKTLRCANAIAQFGLDKCKDTRVGDSSEKGISGGERKRTAIAMEWVTQAPILFLDEPTSGLDAHSAMMVTSHLRSIARTGRTVIAVVHQPSSEMFEMIDDILILYEGRIVYLGERAHLTDYLAKLGFPCGMYTNPADHVFNSVLFGSTAEFKDQTKQEEKASERARYLMDSWEGSNEAARVRALIDDPDLTPIQETQFRRKSPAFVQFKYLIKRSARNALRNKMVLHIRLAQGIILGLLLGLIYLNTQNRPVNVQQQNFSGALFFSAASQFILAMISVVDVFSQERVVFLREWRASYYGLPAYYFSKNFIEIPIQIVVAIIYSCINYWLLGFRRDAGRFFIYMVSCMAVNMCGFSVGMFLASICKNMSAILGAIPLIVVPTLLFGGLFVNTGNSTVWLRWIQWLSPIKYSFAATMKNQFDGYN
ncbi:P-loop containing nucleoside triphosphate hydrolase protein, partial [Coemansia spiralis]